MPQPEPRFALNHMIAPRLGPEAFFALAGELGIGAVEIRNDLAGNAILDGTPPARIRRAAEAAGVRILSINALQRFDDWRAARANEAVALADYAQACGAEALVLVPTNDGIDPGPAARRRSRALRPILAPRAASRAGRAARLRDLRAAAEVARRPRRSTPSTARTRFRLVHDTFHHHLAGEAALFPALTGLVHISGVDDPDLAAERDARRAPRAGDGRATGSATSRRSARSSPAATTASCRSSPSPPRCRTSRTRPRRSGRAWSWSGRALSVAAT